MISNNSSLQSGFALLLAILMVGVVLSVTLSIVALSLKQLNLSVNSRDSEVAFQAANAGLECAERLSRSSASTFNSSNNKLTFDCFGVTKQVSSNTGGINGATGHNGTLTRYQTNIEWGGSHPRCSRIDIITMVVNTGTMNIRGLKTLMPNYPSKSKSCQGPGRCTIASVTGYSSACAAISSRNTLRREILLEY